MRRNFLLLIALLPFVAGAQTSIYPDRPIHILVGFAPGSSIDSTARFFSEQLSKTIGQPVIVQNIPGASGSIAAARAKAAPPDGYTLLATGMSQAVINPLVIKNMPYDPNKDFKPISGTTRSALVFVVAESSNIKKIDDLKKSGLTAGSYSAGYQIYTEWLSSVTATKFTIASYRGAGPVVTDLLGGHIDFAMMDISTAAPLVKSKRARMLAIASEKRLAEFPDIPTINEQYPGFVGYSDLAIQARKDVPASITKILENALKKIKETKEAQSYAAGQSLELIFDEPEAIAKRQLDDLNRLKQIAEAAGIQPQ